MSTRNSPRRTWPRPRATSPGCRTTSATNSDAAALLTTSTSPSASTQPRPPFRQRRDLPGLARRIAEIALPHAATATREHPFELRLHELRPLGVAGVESLFVRRTRGALAGPLATVSRIVLGPVDAAVVEAIRDKEERLPAYVSNTGAEEQWLLLVTGEGYEQSTDSVLTQWTRVPTRFARVYLMDLRKTGTLQRVDAGAAVPPA